MELRDSVTWGLLMIVLTTTVPVANCGPYTRNSGSFFNPNGFFHFVDKTHQRYYNFYEHVTTTTTTTTTTSQKPPTASASLIETNEIAAESSTSNSSFSYLEEDDFGPSNWGSLSASCDGMYQSPINLVANRSLIVRKKRPLVLEGGQNLPRTLEVFNEGGAAAFFPKYDDAVDWPRIRGGPLKTDYLFYQVHYHLGSEHTFDGRRYSAEVHFVFYNSLYDSFKAARDQVDGVAVVALVFDVLKSGRIDALNKWTRFLGKVVEDESEYNVPRYGLFTLGDIIGDMEWPYFSYEGSLTTPPCSETVTWIVASERLLLTKSELKRMRKLKGRGGDWVQTFRPTQALNSRRVFIY